MHAADHKDLPVPSHSGNDAVDDGLAKAAPPAAPLADEPVALGGERRDAHTHAAVSANPPRDVQRDVAAAEAEDRPTAPAHT